MVDFYSFLFNIHLFSKICWLSLYNAIIVMIDGMEYTCYFMEKHNK